MWSSSIKLLKPNIPIKPAISLLISFHVLNNVENKGVQTVIYKTDCFANSYIENTK